MNLGNVGVKRRTRYTGEVSKDCPHPFLAGRNFLKRGPWRRPTARGDLGFAATNMRYLAIRGTRQETVSQLTLRFELRVLVFAFRLVDSSNAKNVSVMTVPDSVTNIETCNRDRRACVRDLTQTRNDGKTSNDRQTLPSIGQDVFDLNLHNS